jgi:4-amino-4-deoxy-L-arabinose transferase-like glycosyltransferase
MEGDEPRYIYYANNLLKGYYSTPSPNIDLSNGPGYPLLLVPFLWLKIPYFFISLLNVILHYLSVILLYKALLLITSRKISLFFGLFWALNYNVYAFIPMILTEILSSFLITLLVFSMLKSFYTENKKESKVYLFISGFSMGYLILTKTLFFYVLAFMIVGYGLLWVIKDRKLNYHSSVLVPFIAFLVIAPYLVYTYTLTGRIFYVTNKASNIYWMSTPFEGEYGDWFETPWADNKSLPKNQTQYKYALPFQPINPSSNIRYNENRLKLNHLRDYEELVKLQGVKRDDCFKRLAINNIKTNPFKYAENCIYNSGRLFFNLPYSYKLETPRSLFRFPINGILAILMLFCTFPTIRNWRIIPAPLQFIIVFAILYLGGTILLSAQTRMLGIIVPLLLVWIGYILKKSVVFKVKFEDATSTV